MKQPYHAIVVLLLIFFYRLHLPLVKHFFQEPLVQPHQSPERALQFSATC